MADEGDERDDNRHGLRVIEGAGRSTTGEDLLEKWRSKRPQPPGLKAGVMGSRRADVEPKGGWASLGSKPLLTLANVSELLDIPPHVLRYWESEFPTLSPQRDVEGRRIYRRRDVETILRIRELLYAEKLTIAQARERLRLEIVDDPPTD